MRALFEAFINVDPTFLEFIVSKAKHNQTFCSLHTSGDLGLGGGQVLPRAFVFNHENVRESFGQAHGRLLLHLELA